MKTLKDDLVGICVLIFIALIVVALYAVAVY
jgi:hypothetical protein